METLDTLKKENLELKEQLDAIKNVLVQSKFVKLKLNLYKHEGDLPSWIQSVLEKAIEIENSANELEYKLNQLKNKDKNLKAGDKLVSEEDFQLLESFALKYLSARDVVDQLIVNKNLSQEIRSKLNLPIKSDLFYKTVNLALKRELNLTANSLPHDLSY